MSVPRGLWYQGEHNDNAAWEGNSGCPDGLEGIREGFPWEGTPGGGQKEGRCGGRSQTRASMRIKTQQTALGECVRLIQYLHGWIPLGSPELVLLVPADRLGSAGEEAHGHLLELS